MASNARVTQTYLLKHIDFAVFPEMFFMFILVLYILNMRPSFPPRFPLMQRSVSLERVFNIIIISIDIAKKLFLSKYMCTHAPLAQHKYLYTY